jgi:hypothetical protein
VAIVSTNRGQEQLTVATVGLLGTGNSSRIPRLAQSGTRIAARPKFAYGRGVGFPSIMVFERKLNVSMDRFG